MNGVAAGTVKRYPLPDDSVMVVTWSSDRAFSAERLVDGRVVWAQVFSWSLVDGLTGTPDPGRPHREVAALIKQAAKDPEGFRRPWL